MGVGREVFTASFSGTECQSLFEGYMWCRCIGVVRLLEIAGALKTLIQEE